LNARVVGELISTRAELGRLYASRIADAEKLERKAEVMAALVTRVRGIEQQAGTTSGYGSWLAAGVNNAHLASVATYYDQVPRFESTLQNVCGGYLPCFYVEARKQAEQKKRGPGVGGRPSSDTKAP
jgi:predicted aminopeptidase